MVIPYLILTVNTTTIYYQWLQQTYKDLIYTIITLYALLYVCSTLTCSLPPPGYLFLLLPLFFCFSATPLLYFSCLAGHVQPNCTQADEGLLLYSQPLCIRTEKRKKR